MTPDRPCLTFQEWREKQGKERKEIMVTESYDIDITVKRVRKIFRKL